MAHKKPKVIPVGQSQLADRVKELRQQLDSESKILSRLETITARSPTDDNKKRVEEKQKAIAKISEDIAAKEKELKALEAPPPSKPSQVQSNVKIERPRISKVEVSPGKEIMTFSFEGKCYDLPQLVPDEVAHSLNQKVANALKNRASILTMFAKLRPDISNRDEIVRKYVVDGKTVNVRKEDWLNLELLRAISASQEFGGRMHNLEIPADIWGVEQDGEITTKHVFVPPFNCTEVNVAPLAIMLPLKELAIGKDEKFVGTFHSHPENFDFLSKVDLKGFTRKHTYAVVQHEDDLDGIAVIVDGDFFTAKGLSWEVKDFLDRYYNWRFNIVAPAGDDWKVFTYDPKLYDETFKNFTNERSRKLSREHTTLEYDNIKN